MNLVDNIFTNLDIDFQDTVMATCDWFEYDASLITESDWDDLRMNLTQENFDEQVNKALALVGHTPNKEVRSFA